ncbi:iron-containing alcohol dehydrogenase [Chromohalobacter sarecensis]|uniref:Iron-containing alcohol dehydrogenase n=1 Tax=Chromohalobacter sarecensis TaxID=245294 RepID=A0ABV9D0S7_9GAMM|nr:iron-containing alcohol dehydrogenase [Chromohalobacter sarecensis]MCK0715111.1 iron-containing alcohol dehydrogenase [Chromohalobacter sarecensis]
MSSGFSARDHVEWEISYRVESGPGAIAALNAFFTQRQIKRPLIVTDPGFAKLDHLSRLKAQLAEADILCSQYDAIHANPSDEDALAAANSYREHGADAIIAIGGGSAMDGAKGAALIAKQSRYSLWDFDYNYAMPEDLTREDFPPLITVPTTAGTGAEGDSTAMLIDTRRGTKECIHHPLARPEKIILDPNFTLGLPANLTAWTGLDALTHALESYLVPMFHPMCDGAALQGLGLVWENLEESVENGRNLEARSNMLTGSFLAGVGFLKGLGLVHAISHMVGAACHTHHGMTNAILLPIIMRFNRPALEQKLPSIAHAMRLRDCQFETFHSAICSMLDRLDIPKGLSGIGVSHEIVDTILDSVEGDPAYSTNPVPCPRETLAALIHEAIDAAR